MKDKLVLLASVCWAITGSTNAGLPKRIWTIAHGHQSGMNEYIDDSGYVKGFALDIIDQVCQEGGMDCRTTWAKYTSCWTSNPGTHPSGGRGLFRRWFDACVGWGITVERIHAFSFSQPFLEAIRGYFYTLKDTPGDASTLIGKRIGFLSGWAFNEKCLSRNFEGYTYSSSSGNDKHYTVPTELVDGLNNGEVDVIFSADGMEGIWPYLVKVEPTINCFLGGIGMMARKDSDFPSAWNVGFSKLKATNKFQKFCDERFKIHSHQGAVYPCIGS